MVQPITSVTATVHTPPVSSQPAPVQASAPASAPASTSAPPASLPASPISAGEERAQDGAFVYTLRNTDSGQLLVVIPNVELTTGTALQTHA